MEELESTSVQSDASNEVSSEPQPSTDSSENPKESASLSSGHNHKPDTENGPFHRHPRWIERDNELKAERAAREALEKRYAEMEAKFKEFSEASKPKPVDKRSAMIERLKGIDPEFADFIAELAPAKSIEEIRAQLAQEQQQKFVQSAVERIKTLHSENKVSPELQAKYERELDVAYRIGKIKSMDDVNALYKAVHEDYTKLIEGIKRAEREAYVSTKKVDAKVPTSQPKGKVAMPKPQKDILSKDPEQARAQIVQKYMKLSKAENSL